MFIQNEDLTSTILESGYVKPLTFLSLEDVCILKQTLRDYTLVRVKAEIDQFIEGLSALGVLETVRKYPALMSPLFTNLKKPLTKGKI